MALVDSAGKLLRQLSRFWATLNWWCASKADWNSRFI